MSGHRWPIVFGIVGVVASGPSLAQDFTQGKSPAQLFAGDCAACHKSPQGLAKSDARSVAGFLREHYTTKPEMADALAAYLLASGKGNEAGRAESGRAEVGRNGRNADLRPRVPVGAGDETTDEGPKSSAKLHGTGKPIDNDPRRVRSTAATVGVESTDEKDGTKPQSRPALGDDEAATDVPKPKPRAAGRDVSAGKLDAYARSGTGDKDKLTGGADARLSKLRAYANSGEAAPPAISAPPKTVASPLATAAGAPGTAVTPPPVLANAPPVEPATAPANPGASSDGAKSAVIEEPKTSPEDAGHAQSIDAPKPIVDEGPKPPEEARPPKPHRDSSRSQDGASTRPTGRTDSAANVPTSPMSFLGRILSGSARQSNPN